MEQKNAKEPSKQSYLQLRINLIKDNKQLLRDLHPKEFFDSFKKKPKKQPKIKIFQGKKQIIFQQNILAEYLSEQLNSKEFLEENYKKLNKFDKLFVFYFLCRKLSKKPKDSEIRNTDEIDSQIKEKIKKINEDKVKKTTQQKLQFLVKLGMKKLRQNLIQQKVIDHNFSHKKFYNFYFNEISQKFKIPISKFYDPRNKNSDSEQSNTYKKEYVLLLLNSSKFKADFFLFLQQEIYSFYQEISKQRILRLIHFTQMNIFESLEQNVSDEEITLEEIHKAAQKSLIKNQQSKLPWSYHEIYQSISTLCQIVTSDVIQQEEKQYFREIKPSHYLNRQQIIHKKFQLKFFKIGKFKHEFFYQSLLKNFKYIQFLLIIKNQQQPFFF